MDTKLRLLEIDYWMQKILGIIVLVLSITFYGLVLLIPFGALQVLSGLALGIGYQSQKRMKYLLIVAIFFICWYTVTTIHSDSRFYEVSLFVGYTLFVVPPSLGIWYFRLTAKEYKDLKRQREENAFTEEQILDA